MPLNSSSYQQQLHLSVGKPESFTKTQLETLQKMCNQNQSSILGTSTVALNVISQNMGNPWIVDSGTSDHMTGNTALLQNCTPCNDNYSIRIADGSLSKVIGIGTAVISKDITLHSALLEPKLNCNLLSVSKIIQTLNCVAKFSLNTCTFQDIDSRMMIGNAKMCS
ncbi:hypothetical protein ACOSQ3_031734 [Xanthoceras sorbifolium]